ncbi:MAG: hypothetical protein KME45_11075 [Stenomitos rutilans HA7619-LM2]|nr:hypothetical protein [Stenomitos rutilans HA7619-LM2]
MMPWICVPIASLGAANVALCSASFDTTGSIAVTATLAANPLSSTHTLNKTTVGDYQPPDNGGPGKSGGSGTRLQ